MDDKFRHKFLNQNETRSNAYFLHQTRYTVDKSTAIYKEFSCKDIFKFYKELSKAWKTLLLPMLEPIRLPIMDKEQVTRLELLAPRKIAIP